MIVAKMCSECGCGVDLSLLKTVEATITGWVAQEANGRCRTPGDQAVATLYSTPTVRVFLRRPN